MSLQTTPWYEIALVIGVVLAVPALLIAGLYRYFRWFLRTDRTAESVSER